ncbi:MAG: viral replication protein [Clostridiales bacterium]|jgi:hypothetical protein|nr:viral replication protein [Clostridiales bacterium]
MANNAQSRKWQITINSPQECGLTHEAITEILLRFSPTYFCLSDETGETGNFHTHIFMFCDSPVRFSTLKSRLPTAHLERAYGSALQNREYITKSGRWSEDKKARTVIEGSFYEHGNIPTEKEEKAPGMFRLIRNIRDGMSTTEIIEDDPKMAFRIRDIDMLRQTLLSERYATENRAVETAYIFGASGAGKTRYIFSEHDPRDIYRVTNYRGGKGISFDGYHGQGVLVFEEFASQVPIEEMLNFLDIYPLALPARYNDKTACYTTVYLTSNMPLKAQYKAVQWNQYATWLAFLRRIHKTIEYMPDGSIMETIHGQRGAIDYGQQQKISAETADETPLLPFTP